jgi:hypothetical protein
VVSREWPVRDPMAPRSRVPWEGRGKIRAERTRKAATWWGTVGARPRRGDKDLQDRAKVRKRPGITAKPSTPGSNPGGASPTTTIRATSRVALRHRQGTTWLAAGGDARTCGVPILPSHSAPNTRPLESQSQSGPFSNSVLPISVGKPSRGT